MSDRRSAAVAADRPFYDAHAEAYDLLVTDPVEPWVDAVDRELTAAGLASATILDAGCGTGRHARALLDRGHRVTLLDAAPALLRIAAARCPESDAVLGDVCAPPLDGPVDAITCRGVLNDLTRDDERSAALEAFGSLLVDGGVLLLDVRERDEARLRADGVPRTSDATLPDGRRLRFTNVPTWVDERVHVIETFAFPGKESSTTTNAFTMRPWTTDELRTRLADAGFDDVRIEPGVGRRTPDRLFVVARRVRAARSG